MANDIRVCDKCKHTKIKSIVSKLQAIIPDATIRIGCKSYCGPCSRHAFIYVNGRYLTGTTEDEVILKALKYIK